MKKSGNTPAPVRSMTKRKLRLAVVGGGHLGSIHTRLLRSIDDVELVGVVDPLPEARQRLAAEHQTAVFADHRPLLGQIDAAIIATPTRASLLDQHGTGRSRRASVRREAAGHRRRRPTR